MQSLSSLSAVSQQSLSNLLEVSQRSFSSLLALSLKSHALSLLIHFIILRAYFISLSKQRSTKYFVLLHGWVYILILTTKLLFCRIKVFL